MGLMKGVINNFIIKSFLIMLTFVFCSSFAESAIVSVSPSTQSVSIGDTFTIDITIDPEGVGVAGWQFNIFFDSNVVTVNSATEGDFLKKSGNPTFFRPGTIDNSAGTLVNVFDAIIGASPGVTELGILATVSLTAQAQGVSALTLDTVKLSDPSGNPISITLSNGSVTVNPPDATSPSAIIDLSASNPSANSIDLSWTAPGDDGNTGTAAQYDIRYSTIGIINDGNWGSAIQVTGEPTPALAGTAETMTVSGLINGTTYYFAMKTADEVPNESGLSNVPTGATLTTTISIQDINVPETQTTVVPLMIYNSPGIALVDVTIRFSTSVVKFVDVTAGDLDDSFTINDVNADTDGWIRIMAMDLFGDLYGDLKVADITFQAIGNVGETSTVISDNLLVTDWNGNPISLSIDNGLFSIVDNVPVAPSGLSALSNSSASIGLTWTDNSNNETGFKVYRNVTDSEWDTAAVLVTTTLANSTTYTDIGLAAATIYYYRVKATNSTGDSSWSSTAQAETQAEQESLVQTEKVFTNPNPYIKGKSSVERINFNNLPRKSTIRIYTLKGALLKTIEHQDLTDVGSEVWNISGIASGVYMYYINSSNKEQKGKISILK